MARGQFASAECNRNEGQNATETTVNHLYKVNKDGRNDGGKEAFRKLVPVFYMKEVWFKMMAENLKQIDQNRPNVAGRRFSRRG